LRFNADSFLGASHQTQSLFLTSLAMPQSFDDVLGIIVKRYKRNVDEKAFLSISSYLFYIILLIFCDLLLVPEPNQFL
jgi:hypothetical protein